MSKEISPSMLPKLASCPVFVGASGASEAAERGTRIDQAIREAIEQIQEEKETHNEEDI